MHSRTGTTPQGTCWSAYGAGTPVVLVHGVGMDQRVWAPQVRALMQVHEVIVYDMLGHGQSRLPEKADKEALDLSDYMEQLRDLKAHLGLQQPHIVGHSMGALIALEMGVQHPEECRSIAALNGVYCRSLEQRVSISQRAQELQHGKSGNLDGTIARWFGAPVPPELLPAETLSRQLLDAVDARGYARAYQVFAQSDARHWGRLQAITVPTLFATGEGDPNSTPEMSLAMHQALPGSRLEILAGQRHMMCLVDVDRINTLLCQFMAQAEQAKETAHVPD
jgi:pimeloyl-ACP methyl ester carboxylesterase